MDIRVSNSPTPGDTPTVTTIYHIDPLDSLGDIARNFGEVLDGMSGMVRKGAIGVAALFSIDQGLGTGAAAALGLTIAGEAVYGGYTSVVKEMDEIADTATVVRSDSNGGGRYMHYNGLVPDTGNGGQMEHSFTLGNGIRAVSTDAGLRLTGTSGADGIYGGWDHNTIRGGGGNDWLRGRAGNDVIQGDGGADTLQGDSGDDVLNGGGGDGGDRLFGGHGKDRMYIYGGDTAEGGVKDANGAGDVYSDQFLFRTSGGRANNVMLGAEGYMYDRIVVPKGADVTAITLNRNGDLDTMTITDNDGDKNVVETDTFDFVADSVSRTVNQVGEVNTLFHNYWADFI